MGGDGGVVATQRKFIRGQKNPDDERAEGLNVKRIQKTKARFCAQSTLPLAEPIVSCEMGLLYNKEAMLTALIDKTLNPAHAHIRGLKDLRQLVFTANPAYALAVASSATSASSSTSLSTSAASSLAGGASDVDGGDLPARFVCPVTQVEFNGLQPFVVIWVTGHVMSEKAVREMGIESLQVEYGPFASEDIVRLLPLEEELSTQAVQMFERRERNKMDKKKDKRKRVDANDDNNGGADVAAAAVAAAAAPEACGEEGRGVESELERKARKEAKKLHKEAKQQHAKAAAQDSSASSSSRGVETVRISSSATLALAARDSVLKQEASSGVFQALFHKDHEADKTGRDLFMSVAGLRYTLR